MLHKGLYKFSPENSRKFTKNRSWCNNIESSSTNNKNVFDLWRCKLGHPSVRIVKQILSSNKVSFENVPTPYIYICCQLGKSHKLPFLDSTTVYNKPL